MHANIHDSVTKLSLGTSDNRTRVFDAQAEISDLKKQIAEILARLEKLEVANDRTA